MITLPQPGTAAPAIALGAKPAQVEPICAQFQGGSAPPSGQTTAPGWERGRARVGGPAVR